MAARNQRQNLINKQIPSDEQWIFDSVIQFIQSPIFLVPVKDFFDQNCIYFEDFKKVTEEQQNIYKQYQTMIENLVTLLSEDLEIPTKKVYEFIKIGLEQKEMAKTFVIFRIYYKFQDFVKFMTKHNVQIDKQALQDLTQSQQVYQQSIEQGIDISNLDNLDAQDLQQQIKLQKQIQEQYMQKQDQELQRALKDSIAVEQIQAHQASKIKGQPNNNDLAQIQDLEAALALSKLEHDEREKQIQMSEEQQIQEAIKLSQQQQFQQGKPQNQFQPQQQQQINNNIQAQQQQQKINNNNNKVGNNLLKSIAKSNKNLLDDDSDDLLSLSDNDGEDQELAPERFNKERENILQDLNDMDTTSFVQVEKKKSSQNNQNFDNNQNQNQNQPETLEEKLLRLKKQKEILLAKKKQQRQEQVEEQFQNEDVDQKTMQKRKLLYEKINTNLLDD